MPNIMKALKDEIIRLARKESKSVATPLHKTSTGNRKTCADLKKRVAQLERACRDLQDQVATLIAAQPPAPVEEPAAPVRITGKGVRSLRRKLDISQAALAKLLNVSPGSVYNWEKTSGALQMRNTTKAAWLAVRDIGATEAQQRLDELAAAQKPVKKPAKNVAKAGKGK